MKKAQRKIEEKFQEKGIQFQKGDLVLYFKKAEAMRHDTKLENKWKGPYTVTQVLDKGAYKISIDGRELPKTVNSNLLKKYHNREHYEPVVIIEEEDINRDEVSEGTARVNMLTTEELLERISKNTKKKSISSKRNYYRLGRRIIKDNEKVKIHHEQRVSARRTYRYYRIRRGDWTGPSPREFGKMTKDKFERLLKGREEIEGETLLEAEPSVTQERRSRNTVHRKRRSKSTAQPQEAEEVLIDRWTSGLDMPIEGNSLSMKDLGMDLSIIEGYSGEQQSYGLSSQTNDWSGPDEDNNSRPPIADSRSPIADRRSPIADSRPLIADSRPLKAEEGRVGK